MQRSVFCLSIFVIFTFCSLSVSAQKSIVATEHKAIVDVKDAAQTSFSSARINKVVSKEGDTWSTDLQLVAAVSNPNQKTISPRTGLVLTAYNSFDAILGRHYWCNAVVGSALSRAKDGEMFLPVNSNLEGGARYTLATYQMSSEDTDCAQCVDLANTTCGKGQVQSVTCGAGPDGSCAFACKIIPPK